MRWNYIVRNRCAVHCMCSSELSLCMHRGKVRSVCPSVVVFVATKVSDREIIVGTRRSKSTNNSLLVCLYTTLTDVITTHALQPQYSLYAVHCTWGIVAISTKTPDLDIRALLWVLRHQKQPFLILYTSNVTLDRYKSCIFRYTHFCPCYACAANPVIDALHCMWGMCSPDLWVTGFIYY